MNAFKALIPVATLISLVGCGSIDHNSPEMETPKMETNDLGEVSPFDTLQVQFDKDIANFNDNEVTANSAVEVLKVSGSSVYLVGADTTISGLPVFEAGKARHTVTFNSVEDEDGNVSGAQSVTFATYPILDNDGMVGSKCKSNGTPSASEALADSVKFYNGTDFEDGLTFAALLSGDYNDDCPDTYDYFRIYLRAKDSLSVTMSGNSVPLSVSFKGPQIMAGETGKEYQTIFEFDATSQNPSIDTTFYVSADIHIYGATDMKKYLAYYIQVSYPSGASTDPVPYVLTIRRSTK